MQLEIANQSWAVFLLITREMSHVMPWSSFHLGCLCPFCRALKPHPFSVFGVLSSLKHLFSIQPVLLSYLWTHRYFGCTFHRETFTFWLTYIYLCTYLLSLPQCIFYWRITSVFVVLTLLLSINFFAPSQFLNWIAKFCKTANFQRNHFLGMINEACAFYTYICILADLKC